MHRKPSTLTEDAVALRRKQLLVLANYRITQHAGHLLGRHIALHQQLRARVACTEETAKAEPHCNEP